MQIVIAIGIVVIVGIGGYFFSKKVDEFWKDFFDAKYGRGKYDYELRALLDRDPYYELMQTWVFEKLKQGKKEVFPYKWMVTHQGGGEFYVDLKKNLYLMSGGEPFWEPSSQETLNREV